MMFTVLLAAALAAGPISLKYEGPLKDALNQIAEKGGLNVVVAGDLDETVQVNLPNVTAEEALATVAKVYDLEVTHEGKLWVIREKKHAEAAPPQGTSKSFSVSLGKDGLKVAPVPPLPPLPPGASKEAIEQAAQDAKEAAQDAKEQALEAAQDAKEQALEAAQEAREQAQEAAEQAREEAQQAAEEARDRAREARDRAQEARDAVTTGPLTVKENDVVKAAVSYGGPVQVKQNAVVEGDAVAFGGDVELFENAVVEGDAVSFGGHVIKHPNAVVKGEEVSMASGALGSVIAKSMKHGVPDEAKKAKAHDDKEGTSVAGFFLQFAGLFGLGFLLMLFAPQRMKQLEATIRREPVVNGLVGALGMLAMIPLTIVLAVTLVGIPVAALLWLSMFFFVPAGLAATASVLGQAVPTGKLRKTQALVLAVGLLALLLVSKIPVLGAIVLALVICVAMGAIIRTRFGQPTRGLPMPDRATQPTMA